MAGYQNLRASPAGLWREDVFLRPNDVRSAEGVSETVIAVRRSAF
jgi:hypothetical protein